MCRKLVLLAVVFGVIIASSSAASAAIITGVVRSNGATDNQAPIGQYYPDTPPLPTQAGGLMDGNYCFSDRTYPWSLTPDELIGAEYVRTFSSDKGAATVTYAVTFSQPATVLLSVDDRFSPQQTTVDGIVSRFAAGGTFTDTGLNVYIHENSTTDRPMSVYSTVLPAGTYTFGGQGNANNFYTIIALPPPGKALNPDPTNGAMFEGNEVFLTWEPGESAAQHDVYVSTSFADVNTATTSSGAVYKGRQSDLKYPSDPLDPFATMPVTRGDTYYWRIDEVSSVNVWRGDIWSFEVLSNLNWGPSPADHATFVPVTTDLSWSKGALALKGHIIYFGTDFATVNNVAPFTIGGPGYLGTTGPPVTTIPIPPALLPLSYNTTYYWRADVVELTSPKKAYKGEVWSFTTAPENGVGTILLIAPNGAEVLISGGIYTVTWSSTGPISNILIEYSIDNGQSWSQINAVPNSGSCDWLVPAVNSNQCLVRISDANDPSINDVSDGVFTIFRGLTTIYVDDDAPGDPEPNNPDVGDPLEDGSPEHPFDAIQEGINAAFDGDTVIVLPGRYTGAGNRDIDFKAKAITVKGIDPNDPRLVAATVIDSAGSEADPHRGFYFHSGEGPDSLLMGLTITGGCADNGGAVFCYLSSPTVTGCTFSGNSAESGGGMRNSESSPTLTNCTLSENRADYGGGMHNSDNSSPVLSNCRFSENSAWGGGGMFNDGGSPIINSSIFIGNSAIGKYGDGGGMHNKESSPLLINCTFNGNSADRYGGAMNAYRYATPTIKNCILWGDMPEEIYVYGRAPVVTYSNVQGGWPGEGNLDLAPKFTDTLGGDIHLLPDSPCVNAGDPGFVVGADDVDMDGEKRVMLGRVDMGADEFNPFAAQFVVVRRERVERTIFEYECEVVLENISRFAVKNVSLEMARASANMTMIDSEVSFGDAEIAAGESLRSIDTCTFTVDRAEAIDPASIIWRVTAELADTGAKIEHTLASMPPVGPPETRFEYLAGLAEQWLWLGAPGGIEEDTVPDGTVNLADFAEFAAKWGE
jgi:hypothetical protein